jgi:hypothetical protein
MDTTQPNAPHPTALNDPSNLPDPTVNFAHDECSYPRQYRTRDTFGMAYKWNQVDGQFNEIIIHEQEGRGELKTVFLDGHVYGEDVNSLANIRSRLLS